MRSWNISGFYPRIDIEKPRNITSNVITSPTLVPSPHTLTAEVLYLKKYQLSLRNELSSKRAFTHRKLKARKRGIRNVLRNYFQSYSYNRSLTMNC